MRFWNRHEQTERDAEEALAAKAQADIELAAAKTHQREIAKQSAKLFEINKENHFSESSHRSVREDQHDDTTNYWHPDRFDHTTDASDHDRLARSQTWRVGEIPCRAGAHELTGRHVGDPPVGHDIKFLADVPWQAMDLPDALRDTSSRVGGSRRHDHSRTTQTQQGIANR
ncbi:hypothetical protein M2368_001065 [Arthrobacter sp. JUb119]|nr:hypothetical protein [Arthrobacter sp. JUb119]